MSRVPTPPMGWGGYDAPVVVYIHTYLPTYLRTYIHTYHYITLPYITLPYIPYIHTYRPQGGGPEEPDDTVHPYPLVGGGGGVANAAPYIYISYIIYIIYITCDLTMAHILRFPTVPHCSPLTRRSWKRVRPKIWWRTWKNAAGVWQ